jgi:predicted nucleic acid-binding protein
MVLTCADTCCLINLINGRVLMLAATALGREIAAQGLVIDELQSLAQQIQQLVRSGNLRLIAGDQIFASEVDAVISGYNLGLGEAECIAIARKLGCSVATDDGKARRAAIAEVGKERVTGSLGLLRDLVRRQALDAVSAFRSYEAMLKAGAFLPAANLSFFES